MHKFMIFFTTSLISRQRNIMLNKLKASRKAANQEAKSTAQVAPQVEDLSPKNGGKKGSDQEITRKKDGRSKKKTQKDVVATEKVIEPKRVSFDQADAVKQFTEQNRLQKILEINSTLEEQANSAFADDSEAEWRNFQAQLSSLSELHQSKGWGGGIGQSDNHLLSDEKGSFSFRRFVDYLKKFLFGRLYKFDHVLLDNQAITKLVYHIFLLVEFLQILFFCFYKFNFVNEFIDPNTNSDDPNSTETNTSNSTDSNLDANEGISNGETTTVATVERQKTSTLILALEGAVSAANQFRFDTQIKWANFPLLALEMKESTQS